MIKWMLDTNACIAIMNNHPSSVKATLIKQPVDEAALSVISLYELEYGVSKSSKVEQNRKTLAAFLDYIQVLEWNENSAAIAGELRANLEKTGNLIGPYDLLIAAQALDINATLVTHNVKEFNRVEALKLADWVK